MNKHPVKYHISAEDFQYNLFYLQYFVIPENDLDCDLFLW